MNSRQIGELVAARFACITLLTLIAGALATPVAATPEWPEIPQAKVSYADLELTRPAGVAKLYRRIAHAAAQVCDGPNSKIPQNAARVRVCETRAIADAVTRVNSPELSKYFASRTRQTDNVRTVASVKP